ncbi:uncharacterized protein UV8b_01230 [Ustilaginoidea virens]|uniref:Uncharacterized protein n=1 Tax=Ustilaginoidea virens TaxID=1159556 RepID=A0A8E5HKC3_USTVR|nr:uncharacterized protein UV8b_01230 [Ustilaginoidea virens]QUC16989.1 hypothetical protein UV8b_01230 [Ustilaginoidea virens]
MYICFGCVHSPGTNVPRPLFRGGNQSSCLCITGIDFSLLSSLNSLCQGFPIRRLHGCRTIASFVDNLIPADPLTSLCSRVPGVGDFTQLSVNIAVHQVLAVRCMPTYFIPLPEAFTSADKNKRGPKGS